MASPKYSNEADASAPARNAAAVTPNDGTNLSSEARSLYVGGAGDLKVTTVGGSTATFVAVPVGFFPVRVRRVWATGTTATNIVAVW